MRKLLGYGLAFSLLAAGCGGSKASSDEGYKSVVEKRLFSGTIKDEQHQRGVTYERYTYVLETEKELTFFTVPYRSDIDALLNKGDSVELEAVYRDGSLQQIDPLKINGKALKSGNFPERY